MSERDAEMMAVNFRVPTYRTVGTNGGTLKPVRDQTLMPGIRSLAVRVLGHPPPSRSKTKKERCCRDFVEKLWLPTLDNLRNFLLIPTTEALSFFQNVRAAQ
jgi:hypothetical protein